MNLAASLFKKLTDNLFVTAVIVTVIISMNACVDGQSRSVTITDSITNATDTTRVLSTRQILVGELQKLHAVISTRNAEKIADLFSFPIPENTVELFIEDSAYQRSVDASGGKVTRETFIKFFPKIEGALAIPDVATLFQSVELNKLQVVDTVKHEARIKKDPCYKYYNIEIQGDTVYLSMGSASNELYVSKKKNSDEPAENSSEVCESVIRWELRFDGGRLKVQSVHGAG